MQCDQINLEEKCFQLLLLLFMVNVLF